MVLLWYLAEQSEPAPVSGRAPSRAMVLPLQVQAIEAISPQELDSGPDEALAAGFARQHAGEPAAAVRRRSMVTQRWSRVKKIDHE